MGNAKERSTRDAHILSRLEVNFLARRVCLNWYITCNDRMSYWYLLPWALFLPSTEQQDGVLPSCFTCLCKSGRGNARGDLASKCQVCPRKTIWYVYIVFLFLPPITWPFLNVQSLDISLQSWKRLSKGADYRHKYNNQIAEIQTKFQFSTQTTAHGYRTGCNQWVVHLMMYPVLWPGCLAAVGYTLSVSACVSGLVYTACNCLGNSVVSREPVVWRYSDFKVYRPSKHNPGTQCTQVTITSVTSQ